MTISIIVAVSDNGVIGKDGKIPWKLSTDLARFKEITTGNTVVMGRKTFEYIGHPLTNRINYVLTTEDPDRYEKKEDYTLIHMPMNVMKLHMHINPQDEFFIIGGQQIYDEIFKTPELIHRVYLTRVHCNVEGDTFFKYPFPTLMTKDPENKDGSPMGWTNVTYPNMQDFALMRNEFIPKSDKDEYEYDSTFQVWENRG